MLREGTSDNLSLGTVGMWDLYLSDRPVAEYAVSMESPLINGPHSDDLIYQLYPTQFLADHIDCAATRHQDAQNLNKSPMKMNSLTPCKYGACLLF